jgi:hypothetical protein
MYKIDTAQNRIAPLAAKRFGELGFTERKHLKEWLENCPQALAQVDVDELLIIQKEFYGFDDTRERLDLLAIDKDGKLVIIENKLDDTGRDVVWQAHQRVLCGAYDRLMGLSDPEYIAQQWGVIRLLWRRGSSRLDDNTNDILTPPERFDSES